MSLFYIVFIDLRVSSTRFKVAFDAHYHSLSGSYIGIIYLCINERCNKWIDLLKYIIKKRGLLLV